MKPISAFALILVLMANLALLLPLVLLSPPRDNEIWLHQTISAMRESGSMVPTLNGQHVSVENVLALAGFSLTPFRGITSQRTLNCMLGCILIASIFVFSHAVFGPGTAVVSSLAAMTSLGFIALYGTLNMFILPITLAVIAYLLFSAVYLMGMHRSWYLASYLLAAAASVTGGFTMLAFFIIGVILLILLDLEPQRFLTIKIASGAGIIACFLIASYLIYRIFVGPGFTAGIMLPGEHLGLFSALKAIVLYSLPWIPLLVPAWAYGEGPGDQQAWRNLLPVRIAFILGLMALWLSSRSLPQYAMLAMPFSAILTGRWVFMDLLKQERPGTLSTLMTLISGIIVFGTVMVLFLVYPLRGGSFDMGMIATLAGFALAALIFIVLLAKRRLTAGLVLASIGVASAVWCMSFLHPEGLWEQKISFMEKISRYSPLVVYEDDLVMRGYLDYEGSRPLVMPRDMAPLRETAYLAVATGDLDDLVETLKIRMLPVILDEYRAENTYGLVMISPRKGGE